VILGETTSLCAVCKTSVAATLARDGDRVVMRKRCALHGAQEVEIASNADWYERLLAEGSSHVPPANARPVTQGCPFDCGPCASHEQRVHLPVVPITSACNLDCPICYTHNKNDGAFHMGEAELAAILVHLRRLAPEKRIINLTGGEPTMHPRFARLIEMCREEGIQRITVSTHGLRFLADEALLDVLARADARVVLSFDSFDDEVNQAMLGGRLAAGKRRVLDLLERHGVSTTLLPVVARGVNDGELGDLVRLALARPFIRSVELHTMTFTGHGGVGFDRRARYATYDVLADLERQTGGLVQVDDFVSLPSAHPLCYLVTYLLRLPDGRWLPFPRFMARADLRALLTDTLYLLPSGAVEQRLAEVIDRLWVGEIACADSEPVLAALKELTRRVFAPDLDDEARRKAAEERTKAIYVHAHMDEETFDTDRIRKCCVGMPGPDGTNVPSCAYNVLYRERDARFVERPAEALVSLGRGRR
jgi:uncharacterized radical SAM superfamily Fe-S cluster-containing enzyme